MDVPAGSGRYSDGRTAAVRPVRLALAGDRLELNDDTGNPIDAWPLADIRLVDPEAARKGPVRLCRVGAPERLALDDPAFLSALAARCPNLRRSPYGGGPVWRSVALWTTAAVGAVALFFLVLLPVLARQTAQLLPAEIEARTGRWVTEAIVKIVGPDREHPETAFCTDAEGRAALDRMVGRLAGRGLFRIGPEVRVVKSGIVNAVTVPGEQVLVFRGLIDDARSANELAGVLAHELAHAELRHPTELAIKRATVAFMIGLLLGDATGTSAIVAVGQALVDSGYSREAETLADARAVQLMRAAGFAAAPMADFFERLAARHDDADTLFRYFASHPGSAERARVIRALAGADGGPALTDAEWRALKRICG